MNGLRAWMWPLLGMFGGLLAVGVGIWHFAADSGSGTPKVDVSVPDISVGRLSLGDDCGQRDPRLPVGGTLLFTPVKSTGQASARVSCLGSAIELSVAVKDLPSDQVITYEVWVYNNGENARKVGTVFAARGSAAGTAIIDDEDEDRALFAIALVPRDFTDTRRTPVPIGFLAQL